MRMNPFCLTCLIQSQELQIRNFEDEEKKLRYMKEILGYLSASDPDASAPALVKSISRIYENYWGKKDGMEEAKGAFTENYVMSQLVAACESSIFYYSNDAKLEIDFLIQHEGKVVPIEAKAEENLRSKSLVTFVSSHKGVHGWRFSMSDYREQEWMTNIPLYAVSVYMR